MLRKQNYSKAMKSDELILTTLIVFLLLAVYYQNSLSDFIDSLLSPAPSCPDENQDGICDSTTTSSSTLPPEKNIITASSSILALSNSELKGILGEKWVDFQKPYFVPAGQGGYGKYVQDIYDGSKIISTDNSSTFSPKRRIRIYTEVYKNRLPLGDGVFDARGQKGWEQLNDYVYKRNYNPASPESLNVDYEVYYRNVNVLIVAENLEIIYIAQMDQLALTQLEKIQNITNKSNS